MLEKLNDMSPIARLGIAVVLFVAIAAGAWFGVLSGMQERNAEKRGQVEALERELVELRTYQTKLTDLERQIATLQQQIEFQKKIVPDEKEVDGFIRIMQETATVSGVGIRRYVSKPLQQREFYTEVPFEMEIDGPFFSVMNFFERVSKLERIINVSALDMGSLKSNKGATKRSYQAPNASVSSKATATTFFSRSEPQPTPPAAPARR